MRCTTILNYVCFCWANLVFLRWCKALPNYFLSEKFLIHNFIIVSLYVHGFPVSTMYCFDIRSFSNLLTSMSEDFWGLWLYYAFDFEDDFN